jgi:hypothetical protein
VQEYRSELAMQALKKMAAPLARVHQDGRDRKKLSQEGIPLGNFHLERFNLV